jgi:hypothetical protein
MIKNSLIDRIPSLAVNGNLHSAFFGFKMLKEKNIEIPNYDYSKEEIV